MTSRCPREAFAGYLAIYPLHPVHRLNHAGLRGISIRYTNPSVTDAKVAANPHGSRDVTDVTAKSPKPRPGGPAEPVQEELGE